MNTLKFGNGEWYGKKDTILAYNDENSNYKPLPFDFTRASSATVVNKAGLIETVGSGEPRIDYLDNTKGALKLEPSRTNVFPNSDGDLSTYSSQNGNVADASTSIDGFENSIEINLDSVETLGYKRSFTPTVGVEYTLSFFVQMNNNSEPIQSIDANSGDFSLWINNSLASDASKIKTQRLGSSNIYRVSATHTATSTNNRFGIKKYTTQSNKGFRFAAAQLEANASYPTSYIKTQGTAQTRLADSCSQTPPDGVIGQTEGTVFLDVDFDTLSGTNMFTSIRPDSSNKIEIYRSDAIIYAEFASSNSFNFNKPNVAIGRYKIAVAYSSGSSSAYINGVLIGSNTRNFSFTSTLNEIYINSRVTSFIEQSNYNDFKLYNTRLSNSELQALTTI